MIQQPTTCQKLTRNPKGFGQKDKVALFPVIHKQRLGLKIPQICSFFANKKTKNQPLRVPKGSPNSFNIDILHGFYSKLWFCDQQQSYYWFVLALYYCDLGGQLATITAHFQPTFQTSSFGNKFWKMGKIFSFFLFFWELFYVKGKFSWSYLLSPSRIDEFFESALSSTASMSPNVWVSIRTDSMPGKCLWSKTCVFSSSQTLRLWVSRQAETIITRISLMMLQIWHKCFFQNGKFCLHLLEPNLKTHIFFYI